MLIFHYLFFVAGYRSIQNIMLIPRHQHNQIFFCQYLFYNRSTRCPEMWNDFSPAIFATGCGFLGEWFYNPLSGFSRLKKFILSTEVNKSKIKEQMRFCYICPIEKKR